MCEVHSASCQEPQKRHGSPVRPRDGHAFRLLDILRAQHSHERTVVVRGIFGALPGGVGQDLVKVRRQMKGVPEYVRLRGITDSGRRVSLVAALAGRRLVGAEGALLLALGSTIGLKKNKMCLETPRQGCVREKA